MIRASANQWIRLLTGLAVVGLISSSCSPVLKGRYTWGHEVNTIQFCGVRGIYWVRTDPRSGNRLKAFVENHTLRPYTPVYVIVRGHMIDEKPDGFAADYDGIFFLKKIVQLNATIPENCPTLQE